MPISAVATVNAPTVPSDPPARPSRPVDAPVSPRLVPTADTLAALSVDHGRVPGQDATLFTEAAADSAPPQVATGPADAAKPNPWRVKSLNVDYGLMFDVRYANSDMHLVRPDHGTDVVLHDVAANDRTSQAFLYSMPNGYPQPDEPQYDAGFALQFENNWGVDLNVKHNKYVAVAGTDAPKDQHVLMTGTLNGEAINEVRPLTSVMTQYQITNGLNEFSLMATRAFELPAPGNHHFTYNVKAGPSIYLPYTKSTMVNADGSHEDQIGPFHFSGVGAIVEHSLRYEVPVSKHGAISAELLEAGTVAHIPTSIVAGGKITQNVAAHQMGMTFGFTYNFGK